MNKNVIDETPLVYRHLLLPPVMLLKLTYFYKYTFLKFDLQIYVIYRWIVFRNCLLYESGVTCLGAEQIKLELKYLIFG